MLDWLKSLAANPVVKAKVMAWLRWASAAAGTATFTAITEWMATHVQVVSHESAIGIATVVAGAVSGLILAVGSAAYSVVDPDTVNAKILIAATTGSTSLVNHAPTVQAVKVAAKSGTPEALAQVLANLKAGTE